MHWTPNCTPVYHRQTSVNSGASIAAIAQRARADECSCEGPQMKSKIGKRWHLTGSMLGLTLLAAVNQWAWAAGPQTRGPERIRSEERRVGKEGGCGAVWSEEKKTEVGKSVT